MPRLPQIYQVAICAARRHYRNAVGDGSAKRYHILCHLGCAMQLQPGPSPWLNCAVRLLPSALLGHANPQGSFLKRARQATYRWRIWARTRLSIHSGQNRPTACLQGTAIAKRRIRRCCIARILHHASSSGSHVHGHNLSQSQFSPVGRSLYMLGVRSFDCFLLVSRNLTMKPRRDEAKGH